MLRWSRVAHRSNVVDRWSTSQVIGATVPSFQRFPYRSRDILRLYRDFWRLVQRLPPDERGDAAFKLRNEFRSKRHLYGEKRIGKEYHAALARYEHAKESLALRDLRGTGIVRTSRHVETTDRDGARITDAKRAASRRVEAAGLEGMWAALQSRAGGCIPNLRNAPRSITVGSRGRALDPFRAEISARVGGNQHSSR